MKGEGKEVLTYHKDVIDMKIELLKALNEAFSKGKKTDQVARNLFMVGLIKEKMKKKIEYGKKRIFLLIINFIN